MSRSAPTGVRARSIRPDPMAATLPAARGAASRNGILVAILALTMFAVLDVISKILGQEMSVIQMIWVRFVLFVPFALAMAWRPGAGIAWRSAMPWLQVFRVVLLLVEMWFFLSAFALIPLADAHAIGAAAPLLVTALSVPLLGEKVGQPRVTELKTGPNDLMILLLRFDQIIVKSLEYLPRTVNLLKRSLNLAADDRPDKLTAKTGFVAPGDGGLDPALVAVARREHNVDATTDHAASHPDRDETVIHPA